MMEAKYRCFKKLDFNHMVEAINDMLDELGEGDPKNQGMLLA